MAIKLTKNEQKVQKDRLKQYQRYLPTLQLKKQQLQSVIMKTKAELDEKEVERAQMIGDLDDWVAVFAENDIFDEDMKLDYLVQPDTVICKNENIAGVTVPAFQELTFKDISYDVDDYPLWVDTAIIKLREIARLDALVSTLRKQEELLEKELRSTSQRVNLFEKVKIPEAKENIRVIGVFLGDQQTAAVVRGKIFKEKINGGGTMIEKMQMVYVVSSVSRKDEMLEGLRNLGLLHLAEKKSPARAATERFTTLSKTATELLDYAPDKKSKNKNSAPVLSDKEFEEMYQGVLNALDKKSTLVQDISAANAEIERIKAWGEFSPAELKQLKEAGYDLHFYRLGKREYEMAVQDENVQMVRLASIDKMDTVAVIGSLPATIPAAEFAIPEKGIDELTKEIEDSQKQIAECDEVFKKAAVYESSFQVQMLKAQNAENYSSASETAESDEDFVWISGYLPEEDLSRFKAAAKENGWAWAQEDVAEDDMQIPTKVKYGKVSRLIKPVFDILGILPGYREPDISLWFFLFFTLFFAMIIGDAGYGCLILIGTIAYAAKSKKFNNAVYLLFVLSIVTIIWGAITGTWFGLESAMNVPFLRALVIP